MNRHFGGTYKNTTKCTQCLNDIKRLFLEPLKKKNDDDLFPEMEATSVSESVNIKKVHFYGQGWSAKSKRSKDEMDNHE